MNPRCIEWEAAEEKEDRERTERMLIGEEGRILRGKKVRRKG